MTPDEFVRSATSLAVVPYVPEIVLSTGADPYHLWEQTGREPPPFWAFPWAGGQGLARYIIEHPRVVAGKSVLDVASGSGLVAIAAAKAGARQVTATDIDACALAAIGLNSAANGVPVETRLLDLTGNPLESGDTDVVLAADIFYDRTVASHALGFLRRAHARGANVLIADPGRAFLPRDAFVEVGSYNVPVIRSLEDASIKTVTMYKLRST